jgi:hypothetical protein
MKTSDPTTVHHAHSSYQPITPPTERQHATVHLHLRISVEQRGSPRSMNRICLSAQALTGVEWWNATH